MEKIVAGLQLEEVNLTVSLLGDCSLARLSNDEIVKSSN